MDLMIQELDSKVLGQRLGQKLYSPKGSLLLGMGAEIKEFHFRKIREVGYRSVYVLKGQESNVINSGGHVISEKLRASLPIELKDVYKRLLSKDKVTISNAKKQLSLLADKLIREVKVKMTSPPDLVDLKREGDYLYQHAVNVAAYAILIGQSIQYHQLKLFDLAYAALLADFGMQYVDESILYKPGELEEKEYEEMSKHTLLGFQHLSRHCFVQGLVTVSCLQPNERLDRSGYPTPLARKQRPESSKTLGTADFLYA